MSRTRIIKIIFNSVLIVLFIRGNVMMADGQSGRGQSLTCLFLDTRNQPAQASHDSMMQRYGFASVQVGALIPLFKSKAMHDDARRRWGTYMLPSLQLTGHRSGYLGERMLVNAGIAAGGYYGTFRHSVSATIRMQVNEDEFTIEDPAPRYSGGISYTHRESEKFSWHAGLAYTFLLGNVDGIGYLLPAAGLRTRFGQSTRLIVSLPYVIRLNTRVYRKVTAGCFIRPQGGINRVRNNMNLAIPESVVMLRRRSLLLGAGIYFPLRPGLVVGTEAAAAGAQKISFTDTDNGRGRVYDQARIDNGFLVSVRVVWKPWQNMMRNTDTLPEGEDYDPLISDEELLPGF